MGYMTGVGGVGCGPVFGTAIGVILVLYILLVIVLRGVFF
ncbi:YjcZ family sporulation protein [Paenibacillus sp. GCM10023250]